MSKEIKSIEDFEGNTRFRGLTVIHFWAEWNAYDITVGKILSELEPEFKDKVNFCSVDVDQEHLIEFLRELPIINVPTLGYYKNGKKISLEIGLSKKEDFKEKIATLLNNEE